MQILFILWMTLLPFLDTPTIAAAPTSVSSTGKNFCQIYGAVYLERDPLYKNTASYLVFLDEEEAFADMVVYRENNKLFADKEGIWYITPNRAFADHILYVTDKRNLADITVHFTDVRSSATCREQ
ncbi:hypothetical protein CLV24_12259 [Pontibacter ummariensis]|uniref:7(1) septoil knot domain-containing protein n=1 Tax=Pontibacter ummariensis TaxID=1610492 RepID=A0A239JM27_9BACT|nr:DUF6150 family protein [Pontibacter ummariensis]PRY07869.1 hypothetical protein CLV24_12259 [Pontibacter ummariensis]SNT06468.1 hypothetical protein SAMN06296052_12259 [Pontibacter ummariensis]